MKTAALTFMTAIEAYEYARDVVGGRWPEGEQVIMAAPKWANLYERNVLGGTVPLWRLSTSVRGVL